MKTPIVQLWVKVAAFSGEGVEENDCLVNFRKNRIIVWDDVAGYYTSCHSISDADKARIFELAREVANA
jgi:hypothetical protein